MIQSDPLERLVQIIAEDQISLPKIVADLATSTRQAFDDLAERGKETDRRMRETDERMRQTDKLISERFTQTDERIDKLVIAIGEFMRRP